MTYTIYTTRGNRYYVRGVHEVVQKDEIITMLDKSNSILAIFSLSNTNMEILIR